MDPGTGTGSKRRAQEPPATSAETQPRFALLVPGLLAVAGVSGSALLFQSLRHGEQESASGEFEQQAAARISGVERELEVTLEHLYLTGALFHASQEVTPDEFGKFTRASFRHEALRALFWIPPPSADDAARLVVAHVRGPEQALFPPGKEVSEPKLIDALQRCRRDDDLALSALLELGAAGSGRRVVAALPVYDRDERWQGFVCALLDWQPLLRYAGIGPGAGLTLSAEDATERGPLSVSEVPPDEALPYTVELEHGGRRWLLTATAPADLLRARTSWKPWSMLVLGLLATGLLVATVAVSTGRARIQRLVEKRTREVRQAYATLAQEAKERLWAVAETQMLERRLRQIIDLVPNMIYVKDWFGRFLLANQAAAEAHGTTVERLTAARRIDLDAAQAEPDQALSEERKLMQAKGPPSVATFPFLDTRGRRRIQRQVRIPCSVFGSDTRALLCVATDITEQKQREEVLRVQNALLRQLAQGADPESVLVDIVAQAEEIAPGMRCSVLLLGEDQRLHLGSAPSLPAFYNEAIEGLPIGPRVGSCGAAAATGERVVVEDVRTHPNWEPYREIAARAGLRACWSQPIRAANGEVLGTFAMYYAEARGPEPFELELMESMAYLAGIAIERGRQAAAH